ncbi:probable cytochrome P450 12a4, mitochondrial [Clytia hemisphaerica]
MNGDMVFTSNPYDWEVILRSLGAEDDLERPIWALKAYSKLRNRSLLYIDVVGEEFFERRELMGKMMLRPQKIAKFVPQYSQITDDLLDFIQRKLDKSSDNTIEDFMEDVDRWQFECAGILTLNQRFGFLEDDIQTANPAAYKAYTGAKEFFKTWLDIEIQPQHRTQHTMKWHQFVAASDLIYEGCEELLSQYKLALIEGVEDQVSDAVKLAMIVDTLRASTDTVPTVIFWLMIELANNPDVQEKIYQESKEVLSKDKPLSYKEVNQQHYLKASLKEIHRMRPLVALSMRKLRQDVILPSGFEVPSGTTIGLLTNPYDQSQFFEDSHKMKPERWLRNRETKTEGGCPFGTKDSTEEVIPKFAVLPFGHGPRSCVGRRIAENSILVYTMKLVNKYFIHPVGEFDSYFNLFVKPKGKLNVRLEKRI